MHAHEFRRGFCTLVLFIDTDLLRHILFTNQYDGTTAGSHHSRCCSSGNPVHPVSFGPTCNDLPLADPNLGCPGRINILLGVDIFTKHCCMASGSGLLGPLLLSRLFWMGACWSHQSDCLRFLCHLTPHPSSYW